MQLCPLTRVQHRIRLGTPLPFSIRDASSRLLLAKDEVVNDADQLEALVVGGACVDVEELAETPVEPDAASPAQLLARWHELAATLARILARMPAADAPAALDGAARDLAALTALAPDLAIFLLVRPEPAGEAPYGVVRSLHAAAAAWLIASRLGWPVPRCLTLVKAAFTMNVGMLELQERMANLARLASPRQRHALQVHPATSLAMLEASGVTDREWLRAVEHHHERPGGGGYPAGVVEVGEMANALRTVDVYTAKLAGRSGRDSLPPTRAARDLLMEERGNPFALALITEFGLHPPGSLVRLHDGEVAVVVRRTADSDAPRVAVLMGRGGEPLDEPLLLEASGRDRGIAGPAEGHRLRVRIDPERLYAP